MSSINFLRALILSVAPLVLIACEPQDFGKVKPDLSILKKVPASILNIGEKSVGSKNEGSDTTVKDIPLPLKEILAGSLATDNL